MAILTDDCDIRDTKFWMEVGGNGDYYINTMETKRDGICRHNVRFAMSGGNTNRHFRIRQAIVELYRAMEEAELNNHPHDDK